MKAVIIDDNACIRFALKKVITDVLPSTEIFSSSDGVEGLGLIYIVKPDLIFVDTTLPKYAGVELIDFIKSNKSIQKTSPSIFLLTESPKLNVKGTEKIVSKRKFDFLDKIQNELATISIKQTFFGRIKKFLLVQLVFWANISDRILYKTGGGFSKRIQAESNILKGVDNKSSLDSSKPKSALWRKIFFIPWILSQVIESVILTLLIVFTKRIVDKNIEQHNNDLKFYRVRTYPTTVTAITALIFFFCQLTLFVTGGIVILNTRITSMFADYSREVSLDFTKAAFNEKIILKENTLALTPIVNKVEIPEELKEDEEAGEMKEETEILEVVPTEEAQIEEETTQVSPTEEITPTIEVTPTEEVIQPTEEVTTTEEIQPSEVLGEETSQVTYTTYSPDKPEIIFNQGVEYSKLINILEESSLNTKETSIDPLKILDQNKITYQLSSDNLEWYYFGSENKWEKTKAGAESSNTIQEVNLYLKDLPNTGILYLKAYLISDGNTNIELKSLTVVRELDVITSELEEMPKEESLVKKELEEITQDQILSYTVPVSFTNESIDKKEEIIESISPILPVPVIYQASFANGQKVVYGKVKDTVIPEKELLNYTVKVYYTSSTDNTTEAKNKGEFIGEGKFSLNPGGEYTFLIIVPGEPGGYLTAEIEYTVLDKEINNKELKFYSGLSRPVENSTFTVDSTGDETDASAGNGLCLTAGGACTLRAAIQESNALAGSDNIYFSIPVTDAGYRDFDLPDTALSGDSLGGDDYWSIRPASVLPQITESVTIDGETQTVNQGDTNTLGPEIEINGVSAGNVMGVELLASVSVGTINSLAINNFNGSGKYGLKIGGADVTVTNNYIGTNVLGTAAAPNNLGIGILTTTSQINIGIDISNGNVISGNSNAAIDMFIGATQQDIVIAGNKIGLNAEGNDKIPNTNWGIYQTISAIPLTLSSVTIGGDSDINRNFFAGNGTTNSKSHIYLNTPASNTLDVGIYNNFFGTDISGDLDLDSNGTVTYRASVKIYGPTSYTGVQNALKIGESGKGNLFRFNISFSISLFGSQDVDIFENTFCDNVIRLDNLSSANTDIFTSELYTGVARIYNNFFGITNLDPYFGKTTGNGKASLNVYSANQGKLYIKGNNFSGSQISSIAIQEQNIPFRRLNSTLLNLTDEIFIGGSELQAGSLCNGSEQNCFSQLDLFAIYFSDKLATNNNTILEDNFFPVSGCGDRNICIAQVWKGLFELFSGTARRTDLTPRQTIMNLESNNLAFIQPLLALPNITYLTNGMNLIGNCATAIECPAVIGASPGNTSGENGKTTILGRGFNVLGGLYNGTNIFTASYDFLNFSFNILEYGVDQFGNKTDYSLFKFDQQHFASQEFSFDGNSTTHPVISGTERTINGYTYYDRGEPWTNNPTATRNVETGEFGLFQIMEVEYVDANPILQEDGSYIITVDSTSNEDNVSTCGFDDGTGAYSGGGCGGTSGLPDGKTSLREAIIVANNRAGHDIIHFNIPETDAGFINPDGSRTSTGEPAGTYTVTDRGYYQIAVTGTVLSVTDSAGVTIDGYSQPGASYNTALFGSTLNTVLKIRVYSTSDQAIFSLTATSSNNNISGLNMAIANSGVFPNVHFTLSSYNHMWGNFHGTDINGNNVTVISGGILGKSDTLGASINGTHNTIGTNGDGVNDIAELNVISGTGNLGMVYIGTATTPAYDVIAGNYIKTDKTGKICPTVSIAYDRTVITILGGNFGTRIGTNFDGVSDELESNIMGCVRTAHRGTIRAWSQGIEINGNYINCAPDGTLLIPVDNNRSGIDAGSGPITIKGNVICAPTSGQGIIKSAGAHIIVENNEIKGGILGISLSGVSADIIDNIIINSTGNAILAVSSFGVIEGNSITNHTGAGITFSGTSAYKLYENIIKLNTLIAVNNSGGVENSDLVTANDAGDSDTGANELMNYPVIDTVTYLGSGNYKLNGTLDNTVTDEGPFDLEICRAEAHVSNHGGCVESLFYQEDYITQNMEGLSTWEKIVNVTGSTGIDNTIFTTLATNNLGSTSEFSLNFTASLANTNYKINFNEIYPAANQIITGATPLFDWETSIDPLVVSYDIYLNNNKLANVTSSEYQYTGEPLIGEHSWSVTALRAGDVESGEMEEVTFTINPEVLELTLEYPVEVTIDNLNPTLQWTDTEESEVERYLVYLDEELLETVEKIEGTEQELEITLTEEKEYSWKVEGYTTGIDNNGEEITQKTGESIEESFEVEIPVVTPTAASTVTVTPTPESLPVSNPVNTDTKTVEESLIATSGETEEGVNETNQAITEVVKVVLVTPLIVLGVGLAVSAAGGGVSPLPALLLFVNKFRKKK